MKITVKTKIIDFGEYKERSRILSEDIKLVFPDEYQVDIEEDGIYITTEIENKELKDGE